MDYRDRRAGAAASDGIFRRPVVGGDSGDEVVVAAGPGFILLPFSGFVARAGEAAVVEAGVASGV